MTESIIAMFLLVSKFKMIEIILNVVHGQVTVQNNDNKSQRKHKAKESKGLFTRREGYPCVRVTLASGLKSRGGI